jgi:hypothetical protein
MKLVEAAGYVVNRVPRSFDDTCGLRWKRVELAPRKGSSDRLAGNMFCTAPDGCFLHMKSALRSVP